MRLRRKQKQQSPGRRQVISGDRPAAFSYHANRVEQDYNLGRLQPRDQDTRRKERLLRYWRQRLGMLVAGIVLIICGLDVLHLSSNPNVITLTSSSNDSFLQATTVYQAAAQKAFASSLFNDNKITINTLAIQTQLKKEFPELSDVSVTLPLMGHRPIVYIAPTTPSLLLRTANGDFVLDDQGKALLRSDQVNDLTGLQLPVVTDTSGVIIKPNSVALPSSSVAFIDTVVMELKAKGLAIDSLTFPQAAYELDVKPSGAGYFVKFNMHSDTAMQQVGTFLAVKQRLSSEGTSPGSYIDVRLDGRAYYK